MAAVLHFLFRIYEYREAYLTPYNPDEWKQKYETSQWSTKPACTNLDPHVNPYTCLWDDEWYNQNKNNPDINKLKRQPIGDDAVYTYAAWEYIHGHDPTTLNAELPPFGKYLIGISEVVLKNQNIFALLSGIFALYAFYLLNTVLLKSRIYALIPTAVLSFEPLFFTQMQTPLLDLLYAGLLFITLYFFLKKKYISSAITLGLMAATKATAATFPLVIGACLLYLITTKHFKEIKKYLFTLPLAGLVFVATYTQYFLLGHSFRDFLGVQKWILNFYASGAKGSLTAPWEIIFTGKYQNWWGEQSVVSEWHIGWTIVTVGSLLILLYILKNRLKEGIVLAGIWLVAYLLFLSFIPTWSRYFLLVLPFMYTLSIWFIFHKLNHHEKKHKAAN